MVCSPKTFQSGKTFQSAKTFQSEKTFHSEKTFQSDETFQSEDGGFEMQCFHKWQHQVNLLLHNNLKSVNSESI